MLYEWLDVSRFGWHKLNVPSMGLEVWRHLDLVHVACDDRSNGREGLKRFTIGICRPRRVHDHTVPSLEPPQGRLFSVVQLYEGSLGRNGHVIPRRDTDPETARVGDGVAPSSESVSTVDHRLAPHAWSTWATSHRIGSKLASAAARAMCGRASGLRSIASKASRLRHCA